MARVLNVRERTEEQKKEEFQQAQSYCNEQNQKLNQLTDEKRNICDAIMDQTQTKVRIDEITHYYNYLDSLDDLIFDQRREVDKAENQLEHARQEWIEAKREKKVLEKLKERQYQDYKSQYLKEEQKTLDELSLQFGYSR